MRLKAAIAILGLFLLMSGPATAGDKKKTVRFLGTKAEAGQQLIEVVEDDGSIETYRVVEPDLATGFLEGDRLRIRYVCLQVKEPCVVRSATLVGASGDSVQVRDNFEAGIHAGYAIDTFAADELKRYLNPEDSGDARERFVGGFHSAYRLLGDGESVRQLWFLAETLHGVRSSDVDCTEDPNSPLCSDFDEMDPGEATLAILRNATTLEASVGLRYEFLRLNDGDGDKNTAAWFVKLRAGFLTVEDGPDDAVDDHTLSTGLQMVNGRFRGSQFEFGYGPNDLYAGGDGKDDERWKIDAILTWRPGKLALLGINPYARMKFDSDFGRGADSVQSIIGFNFDVNRLFGTGEN